MTTFAEIQARMLKNKKKDDLALNTTIYDIQSMLATNKGLGRLPLELAEQVLVNLIDEIARLNPKLAEQAHIETRNDKNEIVSRNPDYSRPIATVVAKRKVEALTMMTMPARATSEIIEFAPRQIARNIETNLESHGYGIYTIDTGNYPEWREFLIAALRVKVTASTLQ